jgi:hypothetical protein
MTNLSPKEMRVLRHCKVPRAEVMFVTIQHENIRPSNKKIIMSVTMQFKLPDVLQLGYESLRLLIADQ